MNKINLSALKAALIDYETKRVNEAQALSEPPVIETEPYKQMLSKFINAAREAERKHALKVKTAIRIIIAASLIIATLAIVVSCVKPLREFFVQFFEKYALVTTIVDEEEEKVNKTSIEEIYTLPNIPDGFEEIMCDATDRYVMTLWMKDIDAIVLTQDVIAEGSVTSMDTENSEYTELTVGGTEVLRTLKYGTYTAVWKDHGYMFMLSYPESFGWEAIEEIIKNLQVKPNDPASDVPG